MCRSRRPHARPSPRRERCARSVLPVAGGALGAFACSGRSHAIEALGSIDAGLHAAATSTAGRPAQARMHDMTGVSSWEALTGNNPDSRPQHLCGCAQGPVSSVAPEGTPRTMLAEELWNASESSAIVLSQIQHILSYVSAHAKTHLHRWQCNGVISVTRSGLCIPAHHHIAIGLRAWHAKGRFACLCVARTRLRLP